MKDNKIFWCAIAVILIVTAAILFWGFDRYEKFIQECEAKGGVAKIGRGIKLCLDPKALKE